MPALHIFHQPMWMPTIVKNTIEDFKVLTDLEKLNEKIDKELKNRDSNNNVNCFKFKNI